MTNLPRKWRFIIGLLLVGLLASFAVNFASVSIDNARLIAEAEASGNTVTDTPSTVGEAFSRTVGALYGVPEFVNFLSVISAAALGAYLLFRFIFPTTIHRHASNQFNDGWLEFSLKQRTGIKIGVVTAIIVAALVGRAQGAQNALPISDRAKDLIIYYEAGGKSYYESRLRKPTVPAWRTTASGVTIGLGFDLGHNSRTQISRALSGVLSSSDIRALQSVSGMKGRNAYYNGLPKVRHVRVTWNQAVQIFERDSLPRFTKLTAQAFKIDADRLHPHENGALTSLVFNRGSSMSQKSSRREMRSIRYDIGRGYAGYVPGHIRSMKRLWSPTKLRGLHLRRDAEAKLFSLGSRARVAQ